MHKERLLAIIIINWNNSAETLRCLKMISNWNQLKPKAIVVDNGSSHEDLALLQNAELRFQLIMNPINRGYAGGNNAGITKALDEGFAYIMLLNPDASIGEPCVKQILELMKHSTDLGVIGPLLLEGGRIYAGGRDIGIYSNTRILYETKDSDSELITVDYVPGSVLLARRETFEEVGQLEEEFFFSGEIADFCRRVKLAGLRCTVFTGCQASHSPDMDSAMRETLYIYYTLRNRFLFIRRHFRYSRFFWVTRWIAEGIVQIIIALIKRKGKRAQALCLGLKDGVSGRFGDRNALFIDEGLDDYSQLELR